MNNSETILSFDRRQKILEIVNQKRSVSVDELAALFPVSAITIRRDLDRLAEDRLLKRVHGGAVALSNIVIAPKASEQARHLTDEQVRIGREAAKRIADGDFIVLESGSTCQAVIPHLVDKKSLKIVSVSSRIVMMLAEIAEKHQLNMEIISSGGTLNVYKDFLMGPHARYLFESIKVDLAFISVTAIDLEAGISADSHNEAEISRTILEKCARRKIGLVVSPKFNKASFVRVAPAEIFDEIITDTNLDPDVIRGYAEKGIKITAV